MIHANDGIIDPQLQYLITSSTLTDVVAHHLPKNISQSSYHRGKKSNYYILVSENLLHSSIGSGHIPYVAPFISDNRAVNWDIPIKVLFESSDTGPTSISQRGLQLDRPRTVDMYIPTLKRMHTHHKILIRAQHIEQQLLLTTDQAYKAVLQKQFSNLNLEWIR